MSRGKPDDLKRVLSLLKEKGIINDETYADYMLLILSANTRDQFYEIARDLAEISHLWIIPFFPAKVL